VFDGRVAVRRALLVAAFLFLAKPEGASAGGASQPEFPSITMSAGGNLGPGWWILEISRNANLRSSSFDETELPNPERALTSWERQRLISLVRRLPRKKPEYEFLGPSGIDVTVAFELSVRVGKEKWEYLINDSFREGGGQAEITAILRLMHFLRALVPGSKAHTPPPIRASEVQ
jgi:hypothetical protein